MDKENRDRIYNDVFFLKAFAMNTAGEGEYEIMQSARNNARADLAAQIRVKIDARIIDEVSDASGVSESYTAMVVNSRTNIELTGVRVLEYYNNRRKEGYALAVLNRNNAYTYAIEDAKNSIRQIECFIEKGEKAARDSDLSKAIECYSKCLAEYVKLSEMLTIARVSAYSATDDLSQLRAPLSYDEIQDRVSTAINKPVSNITDAALILSYQLDNVVPADATILPGKILVSGSSFTSSLGEKLIMELQIHFDRSWKQLPIGRGVTPVPASRDHNLENARSSGAGWILTGSILKKSNSVDVFVVVSEIETGICTGSADVEIPLSVIANEGLEIEPANYKDIIAQKVQIEKQDISKFNNTIEIWTSGGSESVTFYEGDTFSIFIRSNKEGYVNILNTLSNNNNNLLIENFYIESMRINRPIKLPGKYGAFAPFGGETLIVSFCTEPFNKTNISVGNIYGEKYDSIITESLDEYLLRTRGYNHTPTHALTAETRLSITTIRDFNK